MSQIPGTNDATFTTAELSEALGVEASAGHPVYGVVTDSRRVQPDNLFVALRGENHDGHQYLQGADQVGARVLACQNAAPQDWQGQSLPILVPDTERALGDLARYHRQRFAIPVVGVTGSYGKTTTRALIHSALITSLPTLTTQANFNNEVGLPLTLLQLSSDHRAAVLEMGMRGKGQISYLAHIARPTVSVITNIGPQHIELLGTLDDIALAKAEILEPLEQDGVAVLPADSIFLGQLKAKAPGRVVTFGTSPQADFRASNIQASVEGTITFTLTYQDRNYPVQLPLPGAHNAVNACAALAVASILGVRLEKAILGVAAVEIPGARMRVVKLGNGTTIIDDCYNAGPDSTRAALQTLLEFPGSGRRVAILGAMRELGPYTEAEHQKVGVQAGGFVDQLVGVCGETRPMLSSAVATARQLETDIQVTYCNDADAAAKRVTEFVQPGDVVLIKGSRSVGLEVVVQALSQAF